MEFGILFRPSTERLLGGQKPCFRIMLIFAAKRKSFSVPLSSWMDGWSERHQDNEEDWVQYIWQCTRGISGYWKNDDPRGRRSVVFATDFLILMLRIKSNFHACELSAQANASQDALYPALRFLLLALRTYLQIKMNYFWPSVLPYYTVLYQTAKARLQPFHTVR